MGTDLVFTVLALKRCMEIGWVRNPTKNGFVHYDFTNGEVLGLEHE